MMSQAKKKLLVVEDDVDIRLGLKELLEDEGYEVDQAENGQEALGKLGDVLPDVILLDLMMPVMDGFTFLSKLVKVKPDAAIEKLVIVLTAAGDRANHVKGVRAIMKKPIDIDLLLAELKKI